MARDTPDPQDRQLIAALRHAACLARAHDTVEQLTGISPKERDITPEHKVAEEYDRCQYEVDAAETKDRYNYLDSFKGTV